MSADTTPSNPLRPVDQNRRRLLVALGYGAVGLGVTAAVGSQGRPITTKPRPIEEATESAAAAEGDVVVAGVQQLGPPVFDETAWRRDTNFTFDVAINNGRVMDPDTGYDTIANIGIEANRITHIGTTPLRGTTVIDAANQVVGPGFVDILSYEPNPFGVWYKVADGVTTNLAMHGVNNYANAFFRRYSDKVPVNFGGAVHQHFLRGHDIGLRPDQEASAADLDSFKALTVKSLSDGFAGISFSPEYSPGTNSTEIYRLAEAAADRGHTLFFHVRYSDPEPPGTNAEAVAEVLDISRKTGLSVHIEHITSTGGTFTMRDTLDTLEQARADGVDVTADLYPYNFWATTLDSLRFAGDWQRRFGLTYEDLQIGGEATRLTATTFPDAQKANKLVAALGSIPDDEVDMAMRTPWTMIGSDAIPNESRNNHPRAAGTFARTIGTYVRERNVMSLMDGLAKMTILPTRRVETMMPAMRSKGRLQVGADADITVFDPSTIADRSTIEAPATESTGISQVLVNGVGVLLDGTLVRTQVPGLPITS